MSKFENTLTRTYTDEEVCNWLNKIDFYAKHWIKEKDRSKYFKKRQYFLLYERNKLKKLQNNNKLKFASLEKCVNSLNSKQMGDIKQYLEQQKLYFETIIDIIIKLVNDILKENIKVNEGLDLLNNIKQDEKIKLWYKKICHSLYVCRNLDPRFSVMLFTICNYIAGKIKKEDGLKSVPLPSCTNIGCTDTLNYWMQGRYPIIHHTEDDSKNMKYLKNNIKLEDPFINLYRQWQQKAGVMNDIGGIKIKIEKFNELIEDLNVTAQKSVDTNHENNKKFNHDNGNNSNLKNYNLIDFLYYDQSIDHYFKIFHEEDEVNESRIQFQPLLQQTEIIIAPLLYNGNMNAKPTFVFELFDNKLDFISVSKFQIEYSKLPYNIDISFMQNSYTKVASVTLNFDLYNLDLTQYKKNNMNANDDKKTLLTKNKKTVSISNQGKNTKRLAKTNNNNAERSTKLDYTNNSKIDNELTGLLEKDDLPQNTIEQLRNNYLLAMRNRLDYDTSSHNNNSKKIEALEMFKNTKQILHKFLIEAE